MCIHVYVRAYTYVLYTTSIYLCVLSLCVKSHEFTTIIPILGLFWLAFPLPYLCFISHNKNHGYDYSLCIYVFTVPLYLFNPSIVQATSSAVGLPKSPDPTLEGSLASPVPGGLAPTTLTKVLALLTVAMRSWSPACWVSSWPQPERGVGSGLTDQCCD